MAIVIDHSPAALMAGAALGVGDEALRSQRLLDMLRLRGQNLAERQFEQRLAEHDYRVSQDRLARQDDQAARLAMASALGGPTPGAAIPGLPGIAAAAGAGAGLMQRAAMTPQQQLSLAGFQAGQQDRAMQQQQQRLAAQALIQRAQMAAELLVSQGAMSPEEAQRAVQFVAMDPRSAPGLLKELQTRAEVFHERQRRQTVAQQVIPIIDAAVQTGEMSPGEALMAKVGLLTGDLDIKAVLGRMAQTATPDTGQVAQDLMTVHPNATPEAAQAAARLRAAGVPVGVGDANLSGRAAGEQAVTKSGPWLDLQARIDNLEKIAADDDTSRADRKRIRAQIRELRQAADKMLAGASPEEKLQAALDEALNRVADPSLSPEEEARRAYEALRGGRRPRFGGLE